ncbi:hypothetical protein T4B_8561 [Trichinella pseudospiralis]|uniref:Uncharacterized protein n=2 Tax=Trichinella pseudospiralis TaxID=6337 RepID=A0A0V1E9A2_TRIPS|nr:hypothetical protein T4A_26 [Trichinella pseudospiralis]KRY82066.1 hypothetical protein T4D_6096 [Trichinella pseudospiralis]KRZ10106.1 hypothetical protein T4B_8561 [Trichinella pseudospiralis]KRZ26826.1 hypothetical protein T4C_9808 [Trichinella pseudospiralis]
MITFGARQSKTDVRVAFNLGRVMKHLKIFVYCFSSQRVLINWRQVNLNTAKDATNQSCYVEIENAYYHFDNIKMYNFIYHNT